MSIYAIKTGLGIHAKFYGNLALYTDFYPGLVCSLRLKKKKHYEGFHHTRKAPYYISTWLSPSA